SWIESQLAGAYCGLVCLTPENRDSAWINYESGWLSGRMVERGHSTRGRVIPYLFELKNSDLPSPLAALQAAEATEDGTWRLCKSLHQLKSGSQADPPFQQRFDGVWPNLAKELESISKQPIQHGDCEHHPSCLVRRIGGAERGRWQWPPALADE